VRTIHLVRCDKRHNVIGRRVEQCGEPIDLGTMTIEEGHRRCIAKVLSVNWTGATTQLGELKNGTSVQASTAQWVTSLAVSVSNVRCPPPASAAIIAANAQLVRDMAIFQPVLWATILAFFSFYRALRGANLGFPPEFKNIPTLDSRTFTCRHTGSKVTMWTTAVATLAIVSCALAQGPPNAECETALR
jgi:hypothetical protein